MYIRRELDREAAAMMEVIMAKERLDKLISDSGLASRREAAQLIKNGCVVINGVIAASGADKYDSAVSEIIVGGTKLNINKNRYIMMNKPAGVVSSTEDRREKTVCDLLEGTERRLNLFPAGRLDKDAEGLLLLTNDGDYAHRIISPAKKVYKTYAVITEGKLQEADVRAFELGIVLKDGLVCLPARLYIDSVGETSKATVMIREGKYHQVKRMLASLGKPVIYLKRIAIGGLRLDDRLMPGQYRELSAAETEAVFDHICDI